MTIRQVSNNADPGFIERNNIEQLRWLVYGPEPTNAYIKIPNVLQYELRVTYDDNTHKKNVKGQIYCMVHDFNTLERVARVLDIYRNSPTWIELVNLGIKIPNAVCTGLITRRDTEFPEITQVEISFKI